MTGQVARSWTIGTVTAFILSVDTAGAVHHGDPVSGDQRIPGVVFAGGYLLLLVFSK